MQETSKEMIQTVIPLSEEELDRYFDSMEEQTFLLDYENSPYQGRKFLNYVYNSGMTCDLLLTSYTEALEDLLWDFIGYDKELDIPVLEDLWCEILSYNPDKEKEDKELAAFCKHFRKAYSDQVAELSMVLKSSKKHMLYILADLDEEGRIDDAEERAYPEYVGKNWISIRHSSLFWQLSSDISIDGEAYNYKEFFKLYYGGYRIAARFFSEFTPYSVLAVTMKKRKEKDAENHTSQAV